MLFEVAADDCLFAGREDEKAIHVAFSQGSADPVPS